MRGFLDELRRRKVTKTAAVYAVVAWVVIEASSVIFPALQLPEWTVTFIVVLALIGFPVVLIFSWVFDFTREGVVRTPDVHDLSPDQAATLRKGRLVDFVVIAVLLGVIGWLGWERAFDGEDDGFTVALDSIAVLPFVNMSGDPENEYFGDGLAEELLNALVRVEGLRVAARTSSFEYKGQNLDIRRIGEALNVATVLEGSVRRSGDRVRVTAQLIRAEDGFHLWSETYDRQMQDIFVVQDDISLAIVDALKVTLGSRERALVTTHSTSDVAALEAYMKGRFEMNKRTGAALRRAIEHFEAAIEADPSYARAYSGLADSWVLISSYGGIPIEQATATAEPFARRALELDPNLAEAHASLGLVLRNNGEHADSIAPFERAIELNPSYSPAYHWLGLSYASAARFEDALRVLRKAVEIDPQYLTAKRALASQLRELGRHEEADALWARIQREHPSDPFTFYGLAGDAQGRGARVEAFRHLVRAVELAPSDATMRANLVNSLIQLHDYERAAEQMEILSRLEPSHPMVMRFPITLAFATLEPAAVESAIQTVLEWPDNMEKNATLCNLTQVTDRLDLAQEYCRRYLADSNWSLDSGAPISNTATDAAAAMAMVSFMVGDDATAHRYLDAILDFVEVLESQGVPADEVGWIRELIRAHRGEAVEPLLALLPPQLRKGNWNLGAADRMPMFRPLHGDPRFEAIIADAKSEVSAVRAQTDSIPLPGN